MHRHHFIIREVENDIQIAILVHLQTQFLVSAAIIYVSWVYYLFCCQSPGKCVNEDCMQVVKRLLHNSSNN